MSKSIIIAGSTGTGKTTFVKNILKGVNIPLFIYDVNNEYSEFPNTNKNNFDFKKFTIDANTKISTCIVYEEATIFFSHGGSTEHVRSQLVRKRHTKNLFVFNFHALHQVPMYLLDFCDLLVIKKTKDNSKLIFDKFKYNENIIEAYQAIKEDSNKYAQRLILDIN
jgi:Cdc6-like AAA superfamily ATPase